MMTIAVQIMNINGDLIWKAADAVWSVARAMAPFLLLGFVVAGVLSVVLTPGWIRRHMGQRGLRQIVKAALFGIPLPLCSCGVIPVALSLRRHGAGRGATVSFLASTPQTGVDSAAATWALLGPMMAVVRVILALISGIFSGMAVDWAYAGEADMDAEEADGENSLGVDGAPVPAWRRALRHAFVVLPRDVARPLLAGMVISGLLTVVAPAGFIANHFGVGWPMMLGALLLSIPLYICSTGSIPLALALIHLGGTPGAALVFLVAGPATNAATIATVWSRIGRKAAVLYVLVIAVSALMAGWLLDAHLPLLENQVQQAMHAHALIAPFWRNAATVVLLALIGHGLWARRRGAST